MRVLVLADTHAPRRWTAIPLALVEPLNQAELILHAGDVCVASVLDQLAAYAPVHVVLGNNDDVDVAAWGAADTLVLDLDGLVVGMIHDSGPRKGRGRRMRSRFPGVDLVVYGHSHIPFDDLEDGLHLFNPGSPTDKRRQPKGTYGLLRIDHGRLLEHRILEIGSRP